MRERALSISDLHLNEHRRLDDVKAALYRILNICQQLGIKKLFILGDVFTSRRPTSTELSVFEEFLYRARRDGIEVFILKGNHDESPDGVHSFHMVNAFRLEGVHVLDNPATVDNIFLGHILLFGAKIGKVGWECDKGLTAAQLVEKYPGRRAYLLGDVHRPQELMQRPLVAYSGSIERVDFSERDDTKRAIYMEYETEDPTSFEWKPILLQTRKMVQLDFYLGQQELELRKQPGQFDDAILKLVIHGTEEEILRNKIDEKTIRAFFSEAKELYVDYDVRQEHRPRDTRFKEETSSLQALSDYVEGLKITPEQRNKVLELGKEIITKCQS